MQKIRGRHLATGFWGRDPHCRIEQDQTPDKIKALLQDKLITMGRRVRLWTVVDATTPGVVACTCDKETRPGSDARCLSCYGARFAPGYLAFLHETIFFASAEFASFTLVSMERDTSIKPNRLRLTPAALTGTITTQDKPFTNPNGLDWTFEVAAFRKTSTDTVVAEFSTNSGVTWTDITLINGANKPTGTGNIRFRITLTRTSLTTDSPDFEILRIRRALPEFQTKQSKIRKDLEPGEILILRTWVMEQAVRNIAAGRLVEWNADKAWTSDLAFFDSRIAPNTPAGIVRDRQAGPHPFYEHVTGVNQGERVPIYTVSVSTEFLDVLTHQAFLDRRAQPGEPYAALVF